MTTPEYRLNQLKLNAPLLYPSYVAKRKSYITTRLEELRIKYSNETVEGRKRVLNEVERLKEELALLTSGDQAAASPTERNGNAITDEGKVRNSTH